MERDEISERLVIKSREDLVDFMDKQTKWLIENPDCFKDFLVMTSVMTKGHKEYDIGNKILIYSQNMDARLLHSEEMWKRMGFKLDKDSHPILILGDNGGINELYDISETSSKWLWIPRMTFRDKGEAAEMIIRTRPCEIKFEVIEQVSKHAFYKYDDQVIAVTNGCKSYDSLFTDLACEYAHFEIAKIKKERYLEKIRKAGKEEKPYKYQRKPHAFHARCVSYALAKMYKLEPGNYDFSKVDEDWSSLNPEQIRTETDIILTAIKRIDKRFQNLLYNEPAVSMKADIAKRKDSEAEESEESESDTQEKDECD